MRHAGRSRSSERGRECGRQKEHWMNDIIKDKKEKRKETVVMVGLRGR